jgi:hypothetical protein
MVWLYKMLLHWRERLSLRRPAILPSSAEATQAFKCVWITLEKNYLLGVMAVAGLGKVQLHM